MREQESHCALSVSMMDLCCRRILGIDVQDIFSMSIGDAINSAMGLEIILVQVSSRQYHYTQPHHSTPNRHWLLACWWERSLGIPGAALGFVLAECMIS